MNKGTRDLGCGMLGACIGQVHLQQQPGNEQDLDLVGVQEIRWDKGGTVRAGYYNFFYAKGNENQLGEQDFLYTTE